MSSGTDALTALVVVSSAEKQAQAPTASAMPASAFFGFTEVH
jgi:hypothetical protein